MGKIKYGLATLLAIGFWMDATSATVLELPAGSETIPELSRETGKR